MQKRGVGYRCECDARPHGLGVGFTSPVRKIDGNFCKRTLMSSGTESGIFWNTGGGSNRDLFSLELKLDEQYEAGGAAGGKMWAGGAAAEQANCIWLSSGETMTLCFLKKSMPRMGPATVACRKVDVKNLPWNCTVFLIKPQEGMGWPSAPLRRGPDGLEFW